MGYSNYYSYDQKIHRCELFFGNITLPELSTSMGEAGINLPQLQAGAALTEEVMNLAEKQRRENRELDEAFEKYHEKRNELVENFIRIRKWVKVALITDMERFIRLGFTPMARTSKQRIAQAAKCYTALLSDETAMGMLGAYMITSEKIENELLELTNLAALEKNVLKEKGDAQMAIKQRDAKLEELEELYSKFSTIAGLVFEKEPQILEKLGIVVFS